MTCKQCGGGVPAPEGHSNTHDRFEVRVVHENYLGDHSAEVLTDAGVFCSWRCIAAYAESRSGASVP